MARDFHQMSPLKSLPALRRSTLWACCLLTAGIVPTVSASAQQPVRFATFNASLNREAAGQLAEQLATDNRQAQQVAAIIQRVRPDVLLLNEFDWDAEARAATLFRQRFLAAGQLGEQGIEYPFSYTAPVNTGVLTGLDIDGDGADDGPQDAFGFGRFPGQYGMLVLSRFPIAQEHVRTFQQFLWRDLPAAELPRQPNSDRPYYSDQVSQIFRLSSKSHWDVPIQINSQVVHLLASHPTPPVFDGVEDRNGLRNQAEIRFWSEYLDNHPSRATALYDDQQQRGGLAAGALFVLAGDLNSDPHDGDSRHTAIQQLLTHSRVQSLPTPSSQGAVEQARRQAGVNLDHHGDPAHDTADFSDRPGGSGNLRVDYVLPSQELHVISCGVFWPAQDEPAAAWIRCSDHRLVWVDVAVGEPTSD